MIMIAFLAVALVVRNDVLVSGMILSAPRLHTRYMNNHAQESFVYNQRRTTTTTSSSRLDASVLKEKDALAHFEEKEEENYTVTLKSKPKVFRMINKNKKKQTNALYSTIKKGGGEKGWANKIYQQCMIQQQQQQQNNNKKIGRKKKKRYLSRDLLHKIGPAITTLVRTKCPQAPEKAEVMLNCCIDEFEAGNPNATLTIPLFNTAMDSWAKSRRPCAPQKILDILQRIKQLRQTHSLHHVHPNVISLSTLVFSWANLRTDKGARKALDILHYMEKQDDHTLHPTTTTYNQVLMALVHSQDSLEKFQRVQSLIQHMQHRSRTLGQDCEPDIYSFQALLTVLSRRQKKSRQQQQQYSRQQEEEDFVVYQVEKIMNFLKDQYKEGKVELTPNCHCFTAAIHAWATSFDIENRARKAYQLLLEMTRLYITTGKSNVEPSVATFTAVLNACVLPPTTTTTQHDEERRRENLQIALLVMEEIKWNRHLQYNNNKKKKKKNDNNDKIRANFLTYAAMLQVIATTLDKGSDYRRNLSERFFREALTMGLVGNIVLEKLRLCDSDLHDTICQEITVQDENGNSMVKIPPEWSRNVQGERDRYCNKNKSNKNND